MTNPQSINTYSTSMETVYTGIAGEKVYSMIPNFFHEFHDDNSVHVINSGLVPGPSGITSLNMPVDRLRKYLRDNITENMKVCFDNLYEGNFTPVVHKIYTAISDTNILPSQCYFFSSALDSNKLHDAYCIDHAISSRINVLSCNTWEYSLRKNSEITESEFKISIKDKVFLCFNRILRPHRLCLAALLNDRNLIDRSYYSFFIDSTYNVGHNHLPVFLREIRDSTDHGTYTTVIDNLKLLGPTLPWKLNIDWSENANYVKSDDLTYFQNSYLSLVTETYFFPTIKEDKQPDDQSIFFSEKTFKPILMKHPFILVGRPGSLSMLRKLGFRTFMPYINELYDTLDNDCERLNAVVDEIDRLSKFTNEDWINWQTAVRDVVYHNYHVLMAREKHMYAFTRNNDETQY